MSLISPRVKGLYLMPSNVLVSASQNAPQDTSHDICGVQRTICCIVGGGPGGAVLALLLAREGVPVTLLEAHHDSLGF